MRVLPAVRSLCHDSPGVNLGVVSLLHILKLELELCRSPPRHRSSKNAAMIRQGKCGHEIIKSSL